MTKRLRSQISKLARYVAKVEGKKSQAKFGDIEEILKDLAMAEARSMAQGHRYTKYPTYILAEYATAIVDKDMHLLGGKKKGRKKK